MTTYVSIDIGKRNFAYSVIQNYNILESKIIDVVSLCESYKHTYLSQRCTQAVKEIATRLSFKDWIVIVEN